jgi:hypothetical protein
MGSVSALSAGAYTTALLVMVDTVKEGWRALQLHTHTRLGCFYRRHVSTIVVPWAMEGKLFQENCHSYEKQTNALVFILAIYAPIIYTSHAQCF